MPRARDLTGQRFGRLIVLGLNPEPYISSGGKKTRRWDCRCDCGKELTVLHNALTASKNGTKSCGCARAEKSRDRAINLTGRKFGRLTVLHQEELEVPESNGNRLGWRCRCDCGNEIVRSYKHLREIQSCGCLLSEIAYSKLVENNVVGYHNGTVLSAIRPERGPNKNSKSGVKGVYWSTREQCWIAKIGLRGRSITIGRFENLSDAAKARAAAEDEIYGPILDESPSGKRE